MYYLKTWKVKHIQNSQKLKDQITPSGGELMEKQEILYIADGNINQNFYHEA